MMSIIAEYATDVYRLFYPKICGGCDLPLTKGEKHLCLHCRLGLPYTNFESLKDNPVEQVFAGRVNIEFATSMLFFTKGEKVQQIMHNIKYNDSKELAIYIGRLFGERLQNKLLPNDVSVIVPVPLHPKKQYLRGYNQSELFAEGMNEVLKLKLATNSIIRTVDTSSQTNKNRTERWENVSDVFKIKQLQSIKDKHVLLVDDVLTTGATLEACANSLIKEGNCKVSVATIATGMNN